MDLFAEVIIFFVGIAVGAIAMAMRNKLVGDGQHTKSKLAECEQQNSQLKQEWQDHLAEYRSIATNLQEMALHVERQIEDAEQVLQPKEQSPQFPFFSSEATQILKTANRKKRSKSVVDNQPLDYSGKASGVFVGDEKPQEQKQQ